MTSATTSQVGPCVTEYLRANGVAAARGVTLRPQYFDGTRAALAVAKGEASDGHFTFRSPGRSAQVNAQFPFAKGALVVALGYPRASYGPGELQIASYALDRSYDRLREVLAGVVEILREHGVRGTPVADSNSAFDKGLARQAGLGWVGKHSLVMVPGVGATVVLGSVMTSEVIDVSLGRVPKGDPCRRCRRCIDACPVGAIIKDGVVDVSRCLATVVQAPTLSHVNRSSIGTRVYGCDACINACPLGSDNVREVSGVSLLEVLESSKEEVLDRFSTWYIPSRDPVMVWRNVLVARANAGISLSGGEALAVARQVLSSDPRLSVEALRCLVKSRAKGIRWSTSSLPTTSLPRLGESSRTSMRFTVGHHGTRLLS